MAVTGGALFSAIYGTGVTSYSGTTPLPGTAGAVDSHWTLVSQPPGAACTASTSAYIATTPPSVWTSPANGAQWITPKANGGAACPPGLYVYEQAVNLTGYNLSGATVSGWFSGDDYATLKMIHRVGLTDTVMPPTIQATAFYCPAFAPLYLTASFCGMMPFTIPGSSFSADGNNVLRLEVNNAGSNPTGTYFEVDPVAPPPGSLSLYTSVSSVSLVAGGPASPVTVTLTPAGGFRGAATLSATGLPSGVSIVTPSPIPAVYVGPAAVLIALNLQASSSAAAVSGAQFTFNAAPASPAPIALTVTSTTVPTPTITTSSLSNGWIYTYYSQTLAAIGGSGSYNSWTVVSGSLPAGITVCSGGMLCGNPTVSGTFSFTLRVTDTASGTTTAAFTLTVWPGPPDFIMTVSPGASQTVAPNSSATFTISLTPLNGLTQTVLFSTAGLTQYVQFSPNPVGPNPTAPQVAWQTTVTILPLPNATSFPVTIYAQPVTVYSSSSLAQLSVSHTVTLTVNYAPGTQPSVTCSPNPATVSPGQAVTFTAVGSGGTPPYTYTWSPPGNGSGPTITLQPSATVTESVTVRDGAAQTASSNCSVSVQSAISVTVPSTIRARSAPLPLARLLGSSEARQTSVRDPKITPSLIASKTYTPSASPPLGTR